MTLASTPPLMDYVEDGVTLVHAVPFQFQATTDVVCSRITAGVETLLVNGADYTVTGGNGATGSVTKATGGTAGSTFRVKRVTLQAQTTTFTNAGSFPSANVEKAFDRDMAVDQETAIAFSLLEGRTVHGASGDTIPALPAAASRLSRFMQWAADGKSLLLLSVSDLATVLAAPIAALMGVASKGDPGANVMAIGLFAFAAALSIPGGTDAVRTSGYSKAGVGIADYVSDAVVDAAYVAAHPRSSFITANGRGFRLANESAFGISAKWFGAMGDGITDDTVAIQAGLDYVNSLGGGTLFFPQGTYIHSAFLNAHPRTVVRGSGLGGTVLQSAHAGGGGATAGQNLANGSGLRTSSPINSSTGIYFAIEDITIRNTNPANIGAAYYDTGGTQIACRRVSFSGFKYGAVLEQSELVTIDQRCEFSGQNAGGAGVWVVNGSDLTPGASSGFSNQISVSHCQINESGTVTGVLDDGGSSHTYGYSNYNGCLNHISAKNVFPLLVMGGEFEGSAGPIINLHGPCGTGIFGGQYSATSGHAAIAGSNGPGELTISGTAHFSGGGVNPISGCTTFAALWLLGYENDSGVPMRDGLPGFITFDMAGADARMVVNGVWGLTAAGLIVGSNQVLGARQTGAPAAATDAASTQALSNFLRQALINHGAIS